MRGVVGEREDLQIVLEEEEVMEKMETRMLAAMDQLISSSLLEKEDRHMVSEQAEEVGESS